MRVLLGAGGGFKGAFDLPILRDKNPEDYDLILGTSVMAVNGSTFAQGELQIAEDLWAGIDSKSPINGVKGFLAPVWWQLFLWWLMPWLAKLIWKKPPNSLFSMSPLKKLVDKNLFAKNLKTTFGVGVVPRALQSHRTLLFTPKSKDEDYRLGVLASASIAFIMNPWKLVINNAKWWTSDGGHISVLPFIPENLVDAVEEVDAILHFPLHYESLEEDEVDGFFESFEWFWEMQLRAQREVSIAYLKGLAESGKKVRVYAPRVSLGGVLTADRATLDAREEEGEWAKNNPSYF